MLSYDISLIFYTEIIRNLIGILLLSYEITQLNLRKADKNRISLVLILIFHNLMYFLRALGIFANNAGLRQIGPAFSALVSSVLILYWTSEMMGNSKLYRSISLVGLIFSMGFFIIGRIFEIYKFEILGIIIFIAEIIIFIFTMFRFVFRRSPYIRARQRIFLMAIAFILMSVFEGSGVLMMSRGQYGLSGVFFLLELIARILMTLSIVLPLKLQNYLMIFIK